MTDTDRMVAWLRETLDAAQWDAEAAAPVRRPVPGGEVWSVEEDTPDTPDGVPSGVWVVTGPQGENGVAVVQGDPRARHVARHDPAAVLRRIAADRKTVARYEDAKRILSAYAEPDEATFAATELVVLGNVIRDRAEGWGWTEETT